MKVKDGTVERGKGKSITGAHIPTRCCHTLVVLIPEDISDCRVGGWGGGGWLLSQLLVQIPAQAVRRRPAGQGSHTVEICVAISDTHIITQQLGYSQFGDEGAQV